MSSHEPGAIVRHALAGVAAALASFELCALCAGLSGLAGSLIKTHDEARVLLRAVGEGEQRPLRVFVPSGQRADHGPALEIARALRRVLLLNQLQRAGTCAVALLVLWRLELPALSAHIVAITLLAGAGITALAPYALGQRSAR